MKEAAQYVGLAASTLNKYRCQGGGPRFIKVGARRIVYDRVDLDAWMAMSKRDSTSEYETTGRLRLSG